MTLLCPRLTSTSFGCLSSVSSLILVREGLHVCLADCICCHDLPMHLHSINASVPWFSPVAPYAKLQKEKGSGDATLQRNHSKKQCHSWGVKSERRVLVSSSASLAPALGPAPALAEAAASPCFPSPTQAAKNARAPPQREWQAALVRGQQGPGKVLRPGQGAGILPVTACSAGAARQLQGPRWPWGQCSFRSAFAALPDAILPPYPASVSLGQGQPGTVNPQ